MLEETLSQETPSQASLPNEPDRKESPAPVRFADLGLPAELVEVLDRNLITEPFEIQALAIPDALIGRDILGRAPTGSGKTLAFGLPLLARLEKGTKKRPRGLILSPTRELAEQICRELNPLAASMDRNVLAVYGGTGLDRQIRALRKGVDLLVACPGRLLDLINQKAVSLEETDIVVVDEADRMADMGFLPDVRKLLDMTNEDRQTVLFSATLDNDVKVVTDTYQQDPVIHEVGEVEPDLSTMEHRFIKVKKPDRIWLSADVIAATGPTVVFCRTRHGVDRLARQLKQEGISAGYIHGGRSQSQRDRALKVFTDGKVDALVATDVAARGIHVDGVACVIHYDPPADMKDYVHRSGRTARAGAVGVVVSFLDGGQIRESEKMRRKLSVEAETEPTPARQPRSSRPDPIDEREGGGSKGGSKAKGGSKTKSGPKAKAGYKDKSGYKTKAGSKTKSGSKAKAGSGAASKVGAKTNSTTKPKRTAKADSTSGSKRTPGDGSKAGTSRSSARSRHTESGEGEGRSTRKRTSTGSTRAGTRSGSARSGSARSDRSGRSSGAADGRPASKRSARSGGSAGKPGRSRSAAGSGQGAGTGSSKGRSTRKRTGKPGVGGGQGSGPAPKGSKKRAASPASSKPVKSKRSGKPRPKNKKNRPKATGRR